MLSVTGLVIVACTGALGVQGWGDAFYLPRKRVEVRLKLSIILPTYSDQLNTPHKS